MVEQFFGNQIKMTMRFLTVLYLNIILFSYNLIGQKESNFKITEFQDNIRTNIYYYNGDNLLNEQFIYNHDNTTNCIIQYSYNDNKFDSLKVKKGVDLEYNQLMLDDISAYDYLLSKGIKIKFPEIVFSEIRDISNILSVADEYSDFKIDTKIIKNEKIISFIGFNKNIRFYPSYLTRFIHENEIIKDYVYAVEDDNVQWEKFLLYDGVLKRTYTYNRNNTIAKVLYEFNSVRGKLLFEKKFEYGI